MNIIIYLTGFLCLLNQSEQRSTPADDSYVAAVIEYQVIYADVRTHLNRYIGLIKEAADQDADIVVFPEMTLTIGSRSVPVPMYGELKVNPVPALHADLYDEVLVEISEAARNNGVYVVINIQEVMDCANETGEYCPEQKRYLFNTNVVFDRSGAVIDRYRKINLFGEFTRTPALTPDLGIFTTDFGVTFGHIICFDLMFQVPAVQIVQKHNLTDIIFTTMWFSEMPYLTGVQIQQAYAYAMDVNFLGSGANNVGVGSAGSGIFSGKAGALVSIMPGVPTTKVLVARVPKVPGQVTGTYPGAIDDYVNHDNLLLKSDPSLPSHRSQLLVPGYQDFILSDTGIVCRFQINLKQTENTTVKYRAFIQDSSNEYALRHIGVGACAVVACESENITSCPYKFNRTEGAEFQELEIKMSTYEQKYNTSLQCNDIEYYGLSLKSNKFPLATENYTLTTEKKNEGRMNLIHKINLPQNDLISFGIWGRIYSRDISIPSKLNPIEGAKKHIQIVKDIYGIPDENDEL